jgi:hypothetical protein
MAEIRDLFSSDPLTAIALGAALVAIATTPIAFAILGRLDWFKARRGRVMQRPEFSSIVCAMVLVMGIPAIFSALVLKSRYFDKNRYEFDPNKTWSVLDQGRSYRSLKDADEAVRREMEQLAETRKRLVDNVKKLDESMLTLRAAAGTSATVAQAMPNVLQRLAKVRESINLDGPQQLLDFTAPPVELAAAAPAAATAPPVTIASTVAAPAPIPALPAGALTKPQVDAEIATVPEPQRKVAGMLPLVDLPAGWVAGKLGERHLETFNAENLFEKIDGRAESFVQFDVKGMAYANYHPAADDTNEVQVYIFEMGNALMARGKYDSEKPGEVKESPIGSAGYSTAGSTLFRAGPYYTQIVSTTDDPKFAAFALEMAKRIAAQQTPQGAKEGGVSSSASTPDDLFAKLPPGPGRSMPKYVAQDVFGYSFLSDVFMAEYQEGGTNWQGFLRPYADAKAAIEVFDKYVDGAKTDGAEVKILEADGADRMVQSTNIGLVDVYFLKGNVVGGANGATDGKRAEKFAREFAKSLPAKVAPIEAAK